MLCYRNYWEHLEIPSTCIYQLILLSGFIITDALHRSGVLKILLCSKPHHFLMAYLHSIWLCTFTLCPCWDRLGDSHWKSGQSVSRQMYFFLRDRNVIYWQWILHYQNSASRSNGSGKNLAKHMSATPQDILTCAYSVGYCFIRDIQSQSPLQPLEGSQWYYAFIVFRNWKKVQICQHSPCSQNPSGKQSFLAPLYCAFQSSACHFRKPKYEHRLSLAQRLTCATTQHKISHVSSRIWDGSHHRHQEKIATDFSWPTRNSLAGHGNLSTEVDCCLMEPKFHQGREDGYIDSELLQVAKDRRMLL